MIILSKELYFPPVEYANKSGVLAIGGDLNVERLELAYNNGIFPWYNEGDPIVWYCPDPRMVLFPKDLVISKSMRKVTENEEFKITLNKSFSEVISNCKSIYRSGQSGTWITSELQKSYIKLHKKGIAKSVEVWKNDELVGGLYGIDLGDVFCGESMFSKVSNTSKLALWFLTKKLEKENYKLIDCQVYNDHLASLGAREISRKEFLGYLKK